MRSERIDMADLYVPTPKQVLLHQSVADETLYGGAAGGGKSHALVMDAFTTALQFHGMEAWLFRRTYPELEDTLIKTARAVIPKSLGTYSSNRHEMALVNNSILRFRHCNTMDDVYRYLSAEMNALYVDELTRFPKEIYDYLTTRVRANKAIRIRPFVRAASNPGGVGHSWVKARFVDPHPKGGDHTEEVLSKLTGKTMKRTIQYIPATVLDNPHISQGYIYMLESKPPKLRDALLYGNWDAFEGQVFIEWIDEPPSKSASGQDFRRPQGTHTLHPFQVPVHWPIWMSYDHGFEKPFSVGWWAIDQEHDTVYRVEEWYGSAGAANVGLRLSIDQIAKGIRDKEAAMFPRAYIKRIADPHLWDEDGGESIGAAFRRMGIHLQKGDNTRFAGKMQIHSRLRFREDGCPRMYVFTNCRDFLRTMPALSYNPVASNKKAEDIDTDSEDHIYDDTRYFLMEFKQAVYEPPKEPAVYTPGKVDPFAVSRRASGGKYAPR